MTYIGYVDGYVRFKTGRQFFKPFVAMVTDRKLYEKKTKLAQPYVLGHL